MVSVSGAKSTVVAMLRELEREWWACVGVAGDGAPVRGVRCVILLCDRPARALRSICHESAFRAWGTGPGRIRAPVKRLALGRIPLNTPELHLAGAKMRALWRGDGGADPR
jgi:hypothetical protein